MRTLSSAVLISAALVWLVCVHAHAHGQDTRHVTEPRIPASCIVLTARLVSQGAALADSDESKPDTSRIQQAMDRCKPGQAVELKSGAGHDAFLAVALPAQAPQNGSGDAVLHPSEQERPPGAPVLHPSEQERSPGAPVLRPADYRPYVDTFQQQEREATGKLYQGEGGEDSWAWMLREIP